mmetsp:Transcript_109268/g.305712  ORF Transcript_109268/g.305712 Transcript_109268/m.305712 type:complete len:85 (+) Transcript_109268:408-662(+)
MEHLHRHACASVSGGSAHAPNCFMAAAEATPPSAASTALLLRPQRFMVFKLMPKLTMGRGAVNNGTADGAGDGRCFARRVDAPT